MWGSIRSSVRIDRVDRQISFQFHERLLHLEQLQVEAPLARNLGFSVVMAFCARRARQAGRPGCRDIAELITHLHARCYFTIGPSRCS